MQDNVHEVVPDKSFGISGGGTVCGPSADVLGSKTRCETELSTKGMVDIISRPGSQPVVM